MALSWHFHGAFFLLIFIVFPNSFMALACQIHGRFIADSSRIHASFFQSQKIKIMSDSCRFHGSFMAVSWHFHIQALPGYSLPKSFGKSYPKSRCWLSICFFSLISASFLVICQIHVGFMALSWHFLPSDFYCFFLKKIQTNNWIHLKNDRLASMSDSWQIHRGFMALSCHFPVSFTAMSDSSRIHVTFMAVSWHFHIQALPGYSLPKSIGKVVQKVGVGCRFVFFWPNFSFIFGNMSDSCRFHGPFMALSSFWFLLFFQTVSWHLHGSFMALSWRFHGTFLALSPLGMFGFAMKVPWKCHEFAKPRWNLNVRFCLFVSVYFFLFVVSVFLMLFSLMVFEVQIDQFFLGFSLIKI